MVRNWDNHVQMFLFLSVGKQIIFNKNKWSRILCLCCTSIPECTRLGWCKDQKDTGLSLRELEILHGKWILSAEAQNTLWWGCCLRQLVTPEGSREEQPRGRSTHQVGAWEPGFHPKLQINKYCKWIFCSNQSGGFAKAEGGSWGPDAGYSPPPACRPLVSSLWWWTSHPTSAPAPGPRFLGWWCSADTGKGDCSWHLNAKNKIENMESWLKKISWGPYSKQ